LRTWQMQMQCSLLRWLPKRVSAFCHGQLPDLLLGWRVLGGRWLCSAAVCLALDLSGLVADVAGANAMFTATLAAEKGT
jgi:hypothetical protein